MKRRGRQTWLSFAFLSRAIGVLLLLSLAFAGAWWAARIAQEDPGTMTALGSFLSIHDEIAPADIIYVLGGDYERRAPFAARLFKSSLAPRVVIPRETMPPGATRDSHFSDVTVRLLAEAGVPENAVFMWRVDRGVSSTADEMRALALYTQTFPQTTKVVIVTSAYHTRRAQYTAERMLPSRVTVQTAGVESSPWNLQNWWLNPVGRRTVWDEYKKLLYYYPRYLFG